MYNINAGRNALYTRASELTFKRHVLSPYTRTAARRFFTYMKDVNMDIFIYSDESGVFDKVHNQIYVFGGLIFLGKEAKDDFSRRYIAVEKIVRNCIGVNAPSELKASNIDNKYKSKLYRSLNPAIKYGTYHDNYTKYYPPIFPKMQRVVLEFKNSATSTLVRAADIVANNIYHKALQCDTLAGDEIPAWRTANNLSVISLPTQKTIRVEPTAENAADEKSLCDELC